MHNGKVTSNPARQVRSKRESVGRLRYLTREEYDRLCEVIRERFPTHLAELVISVNTGMRLSEQYSRTWGTGQSEVKRPVFLRQGATFDTRSWFHLCLEDAKIEKYVWHSNRHTFCSWLSMTGASIKEIQKLAGHKSIVMSARYSTCLPSTGSQWSSASLERSPKRTATGVN
jgi:integrase